MVDDIHLEPHQRHLVTRLVESVRLLRPEHRAGFRYQQAFMEPTPSLLLPGNDRPVPISFADIDALQSARLITVRQSDAHSGILDVTPLASQYVQHLAAIAQDAAAAVDEHVRQFLDSHTFRSRFNLAYQKWAVAAELLWAPDATNHLATIGHLCRESIQAFAAALAGAPDGPLTSDPDSAKTIQRVQEALTSVESKADRELLQALVAYWRALNAVVQRQVHAGQKDGTPLNWNDARRVVFQTAIMMFEIANTICE